MAGGTRWFACGLIGVALGVAALGQTASSQPTFPLYLQVTNAAGQPVTGLAAGDFTITEGSVRVPLVQFQAVGGRSQDAAPVQAVIVLDEVNTGFRYTSIARSQLLEYLRRAGPKLPVALTIALLTDTQLVFSSSPTTDAAALAAELSGANSTLRSINRAGGFYGDEERMGISLRGLTVLLHREAAQPGRKLVIWMSPGWPYLAFSGTSFSVKQQHGDYDEVVRLKALLANAGVTLDAVDPLGTDDAQGFQTTYYRQVLKPLLGWKDASTSNLGLQVLATQDGGLVLNSSNAIAREIAACVQDGLVYYRLGIAAEPGAESGQRTFHAISVHANQPGLKLRTVDGYYTP